MPILQLQRLDEETRENLGGIYIPISKIEAVYKDEIHSQAVCKIVLSGREFTVAQSVSEVLDDITRLTTGEER